MTFKIHHRRSAHYLGISFVIITVLGCLYYLLLGNLGDNVFLKKTSMDFKIKLKHFINKTLSENASPWIKNWLIDPTFCECTILLNRPTNITTVDEYSNFDFKRNSMKTEEVWNETLEDKLPNFHFLSSPIKIILVPLTHVDLCRVKTFTENNQPDGRHIFDLILEQFIKDYAMTFIWNELSCLQLWWDGASPIHRSKLKKIMENGRFEIIAGGWVMSDEANVHLFGMIDQLIEGHQWLKENLNYTPKVSWSIDTFKHGSTFPYLLSACNFEGAIIQQIHYVWKAWFANERTDDFLWTPYWIDPIKENANGLPIHNMPFVCLSPFICLNDDFRKLPGDFTEHLIKAQFITDENVEAKSDLLVEQYSRIASLSLHNVVLIPIGDFFRYNREREFKQQYINYKKLVDYINSHKETYNAEISFGTPSDYFKAIKDRGFVLPTLKGDLSVYSNINTNGRTDNRLGCFITRSFYKLLARDLENNLRSVEILYTVSYQLARQIFLPEHALHFIKYYKTIVRARRNLALFQQHGAITDKSEPIIIRDHAMQSFESIQEIVEMQERTIELLLQTHSADFISKFISNVLEREKFLKAPKQTPIYPTRDKPVDFVIFNSLLHETYDVVRIRSLTSKLLIFDDNDSILKIQVNPVWNVVDNSKNNITIMMSDTYFEIMFIAKLMPLSLNRFTAVYFADSNNTLARVYCNNCGDLKSHNIFNISERLTNVLQIENSEMKLIFDEKTGLLKSITKSDMVKPIQCEIKFSTYDSTLSEKDPLSENYDNKIILVTCGQVACDVTIIYGSFVAHTVRLFNTKNDIGRAIFIENDIDLKLLPKNGETELIMRFSTGIKNGVDVPEFYTDLNGFQYQPRRKVPTIGIKGNYYPITSGAFIQDTKLRFTILTTHAQGATSLEFGQLEVMIDRLTFYDHYQDVRQEIAGNKFTSNRFWILLETFKGYPAQTNEYQLPSLLSNRLSNSLNYPYSMYVISQPKKIYPYLNKTVVRLFNYTFPCDIHLINLRTIPETTRQSRPSKSALMLLHRQGYNCKLSRSTFISYNCSTRIQNHINSNLFNYITTTNIFETSLTGLTGGKMIKNVSDINIEPMEIKTFSVEFG